ncbi:hypothetical protein [Actinomadura sp. NPDC000929]|uniref:hypothetical protein n=1 Tax=Actinomadura sp. NPDC000929 TaxID=3154517 RepID=UPI003391DBAD
MAAFGEDAAQQQTGRTSLMAAAPVLPIDHWRGGIDDVRVFDRALVRSQVRSVLLTRT